MTLERAHSLFLFYTPLARLIFFYEHFALGRRLEQQANASGSSGGVDSSGGDSSGGGSSSSGGGGGSQCGEHERVVGFFFRVVACRNDAAFVAARKNARANYRRARSS